MWGVWHHLEKSHAWELRVQTLADFRKGHPSFSTRYLLAPEGLIYIQHRLPGLSLPATLVIFAYFQLINGVAVHNGVYSAFCLKVQARILSKLTWPCPSCIRQGYLMESQRHCNFKHICTDYNFTFRKRKKNLSLPQHNSCKESMGESS